MRPATAVLTVFLVLLMLNFGCAKQQPPPPPSSGSAAVRLAAPEEGAHLGEPSPQKEGDEVGWGLTSPAFEDGQPIPAAHTADGEDASPALNWTDPPDGTDGFALVCDDPDAPAGTWVHWVLYGIPPTIRDLPEAVPTEETLADLGGAKQGTNGFRKTGYGGPAPPRRKPRHYHFKLYALDTKLELDAGATEAELEEAMEGHILARAELVGTYER